LSANIDTLDKLYAAFDGLSVEGGWHRRAPALWPEPRKTLRPYRWRYGDVRPILDAAGKLVDTEHAADRRNLTMTNPAEGNIYPTVRSLVAAYQMIRPGEKAYAHRHTPNALRIILDGHGCYTTVSGVRLEMRPGDVLLTPNWAWHSHENVGNEDCYWIDVLDVPLVHLLEPMFFERHPDRLEKQWADASEHPFAFRYEDNVARLAKASAPAHGMASREIELGSPALPTIALHVQGFEPGFKSAKRRTTASQLLAVLEGKGRATIDGETFDFTRGDVIAVPAWRPLQVETDSKALFVRASDEPLYDKLGLLRAEVTR
jgi:gentisate 1,2-dioxygenase